MTQPHGDVFQLEISEGSSPTLCFIFQSDSVMPQPDQSVGILQGSLPLTLPVISHLPAQLLRLCSLAPQDIDAVTAVLGQTVYVASLLYCMVSGRSQVSVPVACSECACCECSFKCLSLLPDPVWWNLTRCKPDVLKSKQRHTLRPCVCVCTSCDCLSRLSSWAY